MRGTQLLIVMQINPDKQHAYQQYTRATRGVATAISVYAREKLFKLAAQSFHRGLPADDHPRLKRWLPASPSFEFSIVTIGIAVTAGNVTLRITRNNRRNNLLIDELLQTIV